MKKPLIGLLGTAMAASMWAPAATANGTLQFIANVCDQVEEFRLAGNEEDFLGRLTVSDAGGNTLIQQENVVITRTGTHPSTCPVLFDIQFNTSALARLLTEPLAVRVEACGTLNRGRLKPTEADTCGFADAAATIVDEPIDSLLDEVVAFVRASFEAQCPAGSALTRIDPDGIPGFVCTDEFALDTELAAEVAARIAADAALQAAIDAEISARIAADTTLQDNIDAEAAARALADAALQADLAAEAAARASADAALQADLNAEAAARAAGDSHSGDVAGPHDNLQIQPGAVGSSEVNSGQVQLRVTGSCPAGQSIRVIFSNGSVACEVDSTGAPDFRRFSTDQSVGAFSQVRIDWFCGSRICISGGATEADLEGDPDTSIQSHGPRADNAWATIVNNQGLDSETYRFQIWDALN